MHLTTSNLDFDQAVQSGKIFVKLYERLKSTAKDEKPKKGLNMEDQKY